MRQDASRLSLAPEAHHQFRVRGLQRDGLDCDRAADGGVKATVHDAHCPPAQLFLDLVASDPSQRHGKPEFRSLRLFPERVRLLWAAGGV